jgi:hypothetical protein
MITGFALRGKNFYATCIAIDAYVHEYVKANWDTITIDAIRFQCFGEIPVATTMWIGVTVNEPECIGAARCQQKIVTTHRILDHTKHYVAPVRIKIMSFRQEDRIGIVDSSS